MGYLRPLLIGGLSIPLRFELNRNAATDRKATGNGQWQNLTSRQVALYIFTSIPELFTKRFKNHLLIVLPNTARKGTMREMDNLPSWIGGLSILAWLKLNRNAEKVKVFNGPSQCLATLRKREANLIICPLGRREDGGGGHLVQF
jgi:hypothetical protein